MAKKIEQLLRVMGDLHRFSENNHATGQDTDELWEEDLELVAAAVQAPADWESFKRKHADKLSDLNSKT